jgi:Response regulator containing a CheY-like receiver domain and an HTH DNA-binding domain
MEETGLRVLVAARNWWTREAVLRVLERRGLVPVDEPGERTSPSSTWMTWTARRGSPSCVRVTCPASRSPTDGAASRRRLGLSASYAVKASSTRSASRSSSASPPAARRCSCRRPRAARALGESAAERYALTPRELDVLRALAAGRTNARSPPSLHLAPSSVKKLVSRCIARLGVRNRVEAALVAQREGVVSGPVLLN